MSSRTMFDLARMATQPRFPVELIRSRLLSSCPARSGAGSILRDRTIAYGAVEAGRNAIGFELVPEYAAAARELAMPRWVDHDHRHAGYTEEGEAGYIFECQAPGTPQQLSVAPTDPTGLSLSWSVRLGGVIRWAR